ncbi:MAG: type II toxin-antitoxin system Phd/YefM family antitoxin [Leptospiraceae bacterium]|nr:type II toxin-antitoxin system Phd/YefM family antitoxin [Leptospiraceae bacterium]
MILIDENSILHTANSSKKRNVTIAEAKNHLPKLIHNSETHGVIPISRHGKVVAYLVSEKEYRRLTTKSNQFTEKLQSFRNKHILSSKDIWKDIRSKEQGREVSL